MSNEYENLAKMILSTPQGTRIIQSLDRMNAFMLTPKGSDLLTILANGGSDAIKQCAIAALSETKDKAKSAISSLLSSQEGAALAAKLIEIMR